MFLWEKVTINGHIFNGYVKLPVGNGDFLVTYGDGCADLDPWEWWEWWEWLMALWDET